MKNTLFLNENQITKKIKALLFICLSFFALIMSLSLINAKEKTVKVGYFNVSNFQEGGAYTEKSGYSYEFMQRVSYYTDWKYEYVYDTWSNCYEKLKKGEIDALAGVSLTEERKSLFEFADHEMGKESYYMYTLRSNKSITDDNKASLNGKRIGVVNNNIATKYALDWASKNGISFESKNYASLKASELGLINNEIDIAIVTSNSSFDVTKFKLLNQVGADDYYFALAKGRTDLLEELNYAQSNILQNDPYYTERLSEKYFDGFYVNSSLTLKEENYLKNHSSIKIGYLNNYMPFSDTKNNEPSGMITDIIPHVLELLSINDKLSVEYIGYDSSDEMVNALKSGNVDAIFPIGGGTNYAEKTGIYLSTPVISSGMDLVYYGEYSHTVTDRIAVNINNQLQSLFTKSKYPNATIIECNSIEECLYAVLNGKAGSTVLNGLRTTALLSNSEFKKLNSVMTPYDEDRCVAVNSGNSDLLYILNHGLSLMEDDYATKSSYRYITDVTKGTYSAKDFISENLVWIIVLVSSISLVVLTVFIVSYRNVKKAEKKAIRASLLGSALTKDIANVYILNYKTQTVRIVKQDGYVVKGYEDKKAKDIDYFTLCQSYIDQRVYIDDVKMMSEALDLDVVLENLKTGDYTKTYRILDQNNEIHHFQFRYSKVDGTYDIIAGFSNVDEVVEEELRNQEKMKLALQSAEDANKAKTVFLNSMSHDIRTPMNAIIGYTSLASNHIDNKEQTKDYLNKISVSSNHLLALINDVLDMSRIESGKVKLEENELYIPDFLHEIRTINQNDIASKQIDIVFNYADVKNETFIADVLRLKQILLNVVSNAIKYTPQGGTISCKLSETPTEKDGYSNYEFRIKDNGIGMSEEYQKHLFEAFSREKSTTVSGIQGTGLGLSITKNLVDMMHGNIDVISKEGIGTEFIINTVFKTVPKKDNDKLEALYGLKALVISNDTTACLTMCAMGTELGMIAEWANTVNEALPRIKYASDNNTPYMVYIVDEDVLDGANSDLVREAYNNLNKDVSIILLTDFIDGDKYAGDSKVTALVEKPLFTSELKRILLADKLEKISKEKETYDFNGVKLLIVEDNELNREIAVDMLSSYGFLITTANDGSDAVSIMRQSKCGDYDIILMDVQMPGMDGYEATKEIRRINGDIKDIPIIAMTANAFDEDRQNAYAAGMNAHVSKPIDMDILLKTINGLIKKE